MSIDLLLPSSVGSESTRLRVVCPASSTSSWLRLAFPMTSSWRWMRSTRISPVNFVNKLFFYPDKSPVVPAGLPLWLSVKWKYYFSFGILMSLTAARPTTGNTRFCSWRVGNHRTKYQQLDYCRWSDLWIYPFIHFVCKCLTHRNRFDPGHRRQRHGKLRSTRRSQLHNCWHAGAGGVEVQTGRLVELIQALFLCS